MANPTYKKIQLTAWSGTNWESITPSDSTDLPFVPRGVYVGGSGDVAMSDSDGTLVTFVGLAAGVVHPLSPYRIYATNTSATNIVIIA